MPIFYDHNALVELVKNGGKLSASGNYSVWLWAKNGSNIHLEIAGKKFPPTHTGKVSEKFSWAKAGEVEIEEGKTFAVKIDVSFLHPYFDYRPELIGQMVLSPDPQFQPSKSFELMRVFTDSAGPTDDKRVKEVRHGNMSYSFPTYKTKEEWLARAEYLRHHILVSNGLWPMPEKTPLNANIFGRIEHEDYTVEKVYFESYPGFFVTGNLYRPKGKKGPFPGIISPHGHWRNGRLEDSEGGSIPGRCINFAKQGYVAFSYDMVGYNDSTQVSHHFGNQRDALWGISLMALQLWDSIRSVDFLCSLKDVDPERIACTGASGGGTQTFMLMSVDDRIKVAAPVNMISAHFQGGCLCENSPNLRIDTYNVEIGALMAPRPLLLVSCTGDWTKNTPKVEFPAIQSVYRLFGAEEKVHWVQMNAGHNYNKDSREAVYAWFGRWLLGITDEEKLKEQPFEVEKREDLLVFHGIKRPKHSVDENGLRHYLIENAKKQIESLKPKDKAGLEQFRNTMEVALRHSLNAEYPQAAELAVEKMGTTQRQDFTVERFLIGRKGKGDRIPAIIFIPKSVVSAGNAPGTLIVHPEGKAALVNMEKSTPGSLVTKLLNRGNIVLAIDCFLTGEYHSPFSKTNRNRDVKFFSTFNRTDLALRVQDILTALAYLRSRKEVSLVNLIGLEKAGLWCLLGRGLAPNDVPSRTVVDVSQFDSDNDEQWEKELFCPGIRHAGDFRTAVTLAAPTALFIHNTGNLFKTEWIADVYRVIGAEGNLKVTKEAASEAQILEWLSIAG